MEAPDNLLSNYAKAEDFCAECSHAVAPLRSAAYLSPLYTEPCWLVVWVNQLHAVMYDLI
jgi:hypothetical protein